MATSTPPDSIRSGPPPWKTKSTAFILPFYHSPSQPLPSKAYTPLSASHAPFSAEPECGVFKGGLSMLYLLRYTETPVGPYDELAIMPGYFEYSHGKAEGKKGRNMRVTAIWVSQKDTCWNGERHGRSQGRSVRILRGAGLTLFSLGRKNWNIPKYGYLLPGLLGVTLQ